jgi:hypothetical protein
MITDRDLVLAAAATYTSPTPTFSGLDNAARVFRTVVGDTAIYSTEGTDNPVGWFMDFMALPEESHASVEHPDIGFVHGGIFAVTMSVWPSMLAAIKTDLAAGLKISLVGHSLGAGCSVQMTAMLVALGIIPVRCAFFAPPRVGFKKMNDLVDQVQTTAYRNSNDPVPEVPVRALPLWLYEQRPLRRGGPPPYHPPWDAHHIANYVALEAAMNKLPDGEM